MKTSARGLAFVFLEILHRHGFSSIVSPSPETRIMYGNSKGGTGLLCPVPPPT